MTTSPRNWGWKIELTEEAVRSFRKLPRDIQQRVHTFFREKLTQYDNPEDISDPLTVPFAGKRRFRVGDYRLVFVLEHETRRIYIQRIAHRSEVYR